MWDKVLEYLSIVVIAIVALLVIGGFARLSFDRWEYLIPLVAAIAGGGYLIKTVRF
jgi:hypothetical protein